MCKAQAAWNAVVSAFLVGMATHAYAAGPAAGGTSPGMVKVGGLEFTEAQVLMLAVYAFLFAIVLRRRIVG